MSTTATFFHENLHGFDLKLAQNCVNLYRTDRKVLRITKRCPRVCWRRTEVVSIITGTQARALHMHQGGRLGIRSIVPIDRRRSRMNVLSCDDP